MLGGRHILSEHLRYYILKYLLPTGKRTTVHRFLSLCISRYVGFHDLIVERRTDGWMSGWMDDRHTYRQIVDAKSTGCIQTPIHFGRA